ncbi:MAG: hypothetical protein WA655_03210 [Candidatus Korobacteraceae bacterium]
MTKDYGKLTLGLIAVWFVFALVASALHLFRNDPAAPPLPLGLGVVIPILVFAIWYAASPGLRQFVGSLNPQTLTLVQSWRTAGFVFLVLYAHGILPGVFALPAGWGDIAIGATAPLVALKLANPAHRRSFILWQALGMLDLVTAVTLGTTASFIDPHRSTTAAMTVLPLSLIPTFAVPLLFIFHVICIARARQWSEDRYPSPGSRAPAAVA